MAHNLPASQEKHNTFSYIIICEALDETTEQGDTEQGDTTPHIPYLLGLKLSHKTLSIEILRALCMFLERIRKKVLYYPIGYHMNISCTHL